MCSKPEKKSTSKVAMMCGPAGSGKSTIAKKLEATGMKILSYDHESIKRGLNIHPLPQEIANEIKCHLDKQLILLIENDMDVVLDYSFWSTQMRKEYIQLLKEYGISPTIYYIMTPKEMVLDRIRRRRGNHENDIMLTEEMASQYYDHFQPPTSEEGEIITVDGYSSCSES